MKILKWIVFVLLLLMGAIGGLGVGDVIHDQLTEVRFDDWLTTRIVAPGVGCVVFFFIGLHVMDWMDNFNSKSK